MNELIKIEERNWMVNDKDHNLYECSVCHFVIHLEAGNPFENEYDHCPKCGIKLCGKDL
jgi:hypothetical protein